VTSRSFLFAAAASATIALLGTPGDARPASGRGTSCVDEVLSRVRVANPDEVCRAVGERGDPRAKSNFAGRFEISVHDLGDGTESYVFQGKIVGDAYAYVPSYHFAKSGEELVLVFDGKGAPSSYATARPKVNRRYQIERVLRADMPGLYRKQELETWFWTGTEYAKAFSRITIEGASDPKMNGTRIVWNPATKEAYQAAGDRWTYTVKPGDTLSAIASRFHVPSAEIARQNRIRDAGALRVGQELRYESWEINAR
jgi:hypothetical protein